MRFGAGNGSANSALGTRTPTRPTFTGRSIDGAALRLALQQALNQQQHQSVIDSPQPNVLDGPLAGFDLRFWLLALATGVAAGLAAGLLMSLLHAAQHVAWPAYRGNFLAAVKEATWERRIGVLMATGAVVVLICWLLRQPTGGNGPELAAAIWFKSGRLPFWRTSARAVVSIIIVGMGASLGREAAPKQIGAAFGSLLAGWAGLPPGQQRLLAACGAGEASPPFIMSRSAARYSRWKSCSARSCCR